MDNKEEVEEEINSIVEYVVEDCMEIPDATPEDEDDDLQDPFKIEKSLNNYSITEYFFAILESPVKTIYGIKPSSGKYSRSLEILSPPPKQSFSLINQATV
ncbi:MAG TPA: hypothetical protein VNW99_12910 [Cytophagaceae bacterium]|jgi:hypothetical protein|nr:hypothetical protein [Cytophagaceae bacterium]